jgi:peptide chain release factor 2
VSGSITCGGVFDVATKLERIGTLAKQSEETSFWNDPTHAQSTMRELASLRQSIENFQSIDQRTQDAAVLLELAAESDDTATAAELDSELESLDTTLDRAEVDLMFSGPHDRSDAIMTIQPGAGGTDAQDWAEMMYRMYLRWAEQHGYKVSEIDYTPGEEAGIKNATLSIQGERAFGYLRGERGIHRLVRLSPFNAGSTRETSFARVEVYPDVQDDQIDIEINPRDMEIETYKSQGAGGQNVQKNETAVRIRHIPSGLIVTCQDQRSMRQNRERALHILKVRLQEIEERKREVELRKLKGEFIEAEFGNQIRNYVLHPYQLVKDTRTGLETSNTTGVLNGDLDTFMEAYLKEFHQ